jgi:uncharacterized protein YecE (DUF72 family)
MPSAQILIGTSGYSFKDWVGPFYPPGTKPSEFLPFYGRSFDALELNTSFYGIPRPETIARMADRTPDPFHFVVKLHQGMTHENRLDDAELRDFRQAIEPLKRAGKYDGLLAQFPWSFQRPIENRRHLAELRRRLEDEPVFVEFRHDSWLTPELEPSLREHRIGFCAVDEPTLAGLLPPVAMLTTEDAYVRFHGRNAARWWTGTRETRYDYDYKPHELEEWIGKIRELSERARRIYLFFNNCHAGQAARSAKLMQDLLRQHQIPVG